MVAIGTPLPRSCGESVSRRGETADEGSRKIVVGCVADLFVTSSVMHCFGRAFERRQVVLSWGVVRNAYARMKPVVCKLPLSLAWQVWASYN